MMQETLTEVQSAVDGCEACLGDRYPRFDAEEVALVCKEVRRLRAECDEAKAERKRAEQLWDVATTERNRMWDALYRACQRIADGPQEYGEAKTAKDWSDHYTKALEAE